MASLAVSGYQSANPPEGTKLLHPTLSSLRSRLRAFPLQAMHLALLLSLAPMSALAITSEWNVGSGGNGHLYEVVLFEAPITWDEALADALARGGDLASIESAAEND